MFPLSRFTVPVALLNEELATRSKPIPFRFGAKAALVDNQYKLVTNQVARGEFQLYDLDADPAETTDRSGREPQRSQQLKEQLLAWNVSVEASFAGRDYPEGTVTRADPEPVFWCGAAPYQRYLPEWKNRWGYRSYLERQSRVTPKREGVSRAAPPGSGKSATLFMGDTAIEPGGLPLWDASASLTFQPALLDCPRY